MLIFVKSELRNKIVRGGNWLNYRTICYVKLDIFASIKDENNLYQLCCVLEHGIEISSKFIHL